ncbi:MAG: sigma-70 family RNA polymerase sigma factor [Desulfatitalea sp.]
MLNDQTLLTGCLAQDPALKEAFARQFSNLVFSTIQAVARSKSASFSAQDLEDLHSTVFLRLFDKGGHKLKQYQGKNGCSLASWIRTITVRLVLDHLRRSGDLLDRCEQMVPVDELLDLADGHPNPCEQLAAKEQRALIEAAVKTLSPRDQLTLRLLYFEDHDLATVAKLLGLSETNIHSIKHRAVQRLKSAVQRRMGS